ncbi:MAG: cytochrome c family protein [Pseudomonadota bacterium]
MGGIEFNKIFAAILVAGIIAMLSGFVAGKFVKPKKLKENAFKIEGVASAEVAGAVDMPEPIMAMLAEVDVTRGEKLAKACTACHSFVQGGANGVGPNLWNIVNRQKSSVGGFSYSGALVAVGDSTWTYDELNKFLWKPKKYAPGTKMNYIGLKKPEDRAAMIAWLRMLSPSPKALPSAAQIAAEEAELSPPEPEVVEEEASEEAAPGA